MFDTDGDNPAIGDNTEVQIGTNPLRKDQKVKFIVTTLQLTGTEADDNETGTSDDLEIFGTINLGKTGSLEAIWSTNTDSYGTYTVGSSQSISVTRFFVLNDGESVTLQMIGFKDYDASSGNDPFADADKVFNFPIDAVTGKLSSDGAAGGNGSVSLDLSYSISIVTSL